MEKKNMTKDEENQMFGPVDEEAPVVKAKKEKKLEVTIVGGDPEEGIRKQNLADLPKVMIRLKHTVVTVLPDGLAMAVKMGREVEARRVGDGGEHGIYLVMGTSGILRIVPADCAEEIAPPVLN